MARAATASGNFPPRVSATSQAASATAMAPARVASTRALVAARTHSNDVASTSAAGSAAAGPAATRAPHQSATTPAVAKPADGSRSAHSGGCGQMLVAAAATQ